MKDFIKIFCGISALVAAFMFGSNYGEKTYREGAEYRSFIKATEELSFAKAEFENVKVKLQNITDQAESKKTDELLAQILHIFLTDLGLRIQNKEAILKQAQQRPPPIVVATPAKEVQQEAKKEEAPEPQKQAGSKININKFKSFEWMVQNSSGNQGTLRDLKKVQIKNLKSFLERADYLDKDECSQLLGVYKGSVKDINNKYFGSFEFELKVGQIGANEELYGKLAWYNEKNKSTFSEQIKNNCGKKIKGLSGRIFSITADKYVQLYKLNNLEKIASNLYEVLPNHTSKILGSFILNRVDRF